MPDPNYFGRKRRARRDRGRRIKAMQHHPYVGGPIWLARLALARVRAGGVPLPKLMMLDEVDSINFNLTEKQARAEIVAETARFQALTSPSLGQPWEN